MFTVYNFEQPQAKHLQSSIVVRLPQKVSMKQKTQMMVCVAK